MSYGLPAGTSINYGQLGFPRWVDDLCLRWGLDSSTYPGHQTSDRRDIGAAPNPQGLNRGIDWRGPPDRMLEFAEWLRDTAPPRAPGVYGPEGVEMVIYQDPRTGERVGYPGFVDYGGDYSGHTDHVHTRHSAAIEVTSRRDEYALAVIAAGRERNISPRGIMIALTVPFVESSWLMYANSNVPESLTYPHDAVGSDHDSTGLFQQRQAWGPLSCTMDAQCSAGLFFDGGQGGQRGLTAFDYDSDAHSPGWYAQAVQVSAYPDRYDQHWDEAVALYERLAAEGRDEMFTDEDRRRLYEVHAALFNVVASQSPFRHLGEQPRWRLHELIKHLDSFVHPEFVEWAAERGSEANLAILREVANGDPRAYPDREADIALAREALDRLGTVTPIPIPTPPQQPPPGQWQPPGVARPVVLLTAQGHLVDMWTGYPADLARQLEGEGLAHFQPIGAWDANKLPMGGPVGDGVREGIRLLTEQYPTGPFGLVGFSQGAEIVSRIYRELVGSLQHRRQDFVGGVVFGNPMREQGHYQGHVDPGGHGIASDRLAGTGPSWAEYAEPGDVYTSVSGPSGEMMTAVYDLVMRVDPTLLFKELGEIFTNPIPELVSAGMAIIQFAQFGITQPMTAAHVSYHIREIAPGVTYYDHAVDWMRGRILTHRTTVEQRSITA